jgi:hypothetical protein
MHNVFKWDHYSDQPYILKKEDKKLLRKGYFFDFLKLLGTNSIYFPYLFFKFLLKKNRETVIQDEKSFYGLCVNLDKGDSQHELVEELGDLLKKDIAIIFKKFQSITQEFQIGNAINRIKWSFISVEEYLGFYKTVQKVRDEKFSSLKLIGSSVIDFEYHFTIGTLFNAFNIHYDKFSSLLYVDRRGSPYNKQMVMFNLKNKIEFLNTIVRNTSKAENHIYLTEVNWPISGTAPYAPTSEKECVDEKIYTQYMLEYFDIAKKTGKIEKVFWHQLVAPGYGLVDNRGGIIRKRDAFYAFKNMIEEGSHE